MKHNRNNPEPSGVERAMERARLSSSKAITREDQTPQSVSRYVVKDIVLSKTNRIPLNKEELRKKRIFIDAEDEETTIAIGAYRHLRTNIMKMLDSVDGRTLLVTGPTPAVGKTTTAINLAINISRHSQRTALLVDLDLRKPGLHKIFDFEPDFGVIDILQGNSSVEEVLVTPYIERFTLLPGKEVYENSSELLSTGAMKNLLQDLKDRYPERLVILDSPPVLGGDDIEALAPCVDACLLVVDQNIRKLELEETLYRVRDMRIAGYVMNKSSEARFDRYY